MSQAGTRAGARPPAAHPTARETVVTATGWSAAGCAWLI